MISRADPIPQERRIHGSVRLALVAMPVCLAATQPRAVQAAQSLLWCPFERQSVDEFIDEPSTQRGFPRVSMGVVSRFLRQSPKKALSAILPTKSHRFKNERNFLVEELRINL